MTQKEVRVKVRVNPHSSPGVHLLRLHPLPPPLTPIAKP